jgi:hypothetical protein
MRLPSPERLGGDDAAGIGPGLPGRRGGRLVIGGSLAYARLTNHSRLSGVPYNGSRKANVPFASPLNAFLLCRSRFQRRWLSGRSQTDIGSRQGIREKRGLLPLPRFSFLGIFGSTLAKNPRRGIRDASARTAAAHRYFSLFLARIVPQVGVHPAAVERCIMPARSLYLGNAFRRGLVGTRAG